MTIRVGLLGAGYILKSHALAVRTAPGATLLAVCDVSRDRAAAAAAAYGIPEVFDSVEALAASSVEAVHVLLPPALHLAAARTLIRAGKHVFLEKPMGLDAADCRALADEAAAAGVALGVNHNFLFAPAYQPIRDAAREGRLGTIDHLAVDWLYALPLLQFGPFNNWILAEPGNVVFELGPHLAAFAVDLLGDPVIDAAHAANRVDLPGGLAAWRRWHALGSAGRTGLALTLSLAPGQARRLLVLRGTGGVAQFDFERGLGWVEAQTNDNPILDNLAVARATSRQVGGQAWREFGRYFARALAKKPGANPFEESIAAAVVAFYAGIDGTPDPRLSGHFGARVIALCEAIVAKASPSPGRAATVATAPEAPAVRPTVLVVGGTGFIGRRLVARLVAEGVGVRVLTRGLGSARIDLAGLAVELMAGSHGDPAVLERALIGIDTVYHLAKAEGKRWADYVEGDIEPTRRLAEAALAAGVRRFVYTGTIDSYASDDPRATIGGGTPVDPAIARRNLYARSKATCEALLADLHRTKGLPLVILRPGIVIGAGSPPAHLGVARFVSPTQVRYWGDGTNKLPFVLVDDVAAALALARTAPGIEGESFLVTDVPLMSARDYVAAVEARSGTRIDARAGSAWRAWIVDALKEAAKHAVRHPNRRASTLHDWASRAHRSPYDPSATIARLGWRPAGSVAALTSDGIDASVDRFMR